MVCCGPSCRVKVIQKRSGLLALKLLMVNHLLPASAYLRMHLGFPCPIHSAAKGAAKRAAVLSEYSCALHI